MKGLTNFLAAAVLGAQIGAVQAPPPAESPEYCHDLADLRNLPVGDARQLAVAVEPFICSPQTILHPGNLAKKEAWVGAGVGLAVMGAIYTAMGWKRKKKSRPDRI